MSSEAPPNLRKGRRPGHVQLRPFPDLPALRLAMTARAWSVKDLAAAAGIALSTAYRVLRGVPVRADVTEAIARAIIATPAQTATAAFLRGEGVA